MKKLVTFIILLSSLFVVGQEQFAAKKPSLYVTGTAKVTAKPDLAILNISVSEIQPKMAEAIQALGDKSNFYNQLLKKLKFDEKDIKTTSFNVSKNRIYRNNAYVDSGYVASQNIRLQFPYNAQTIQKIVSEFSKNNQAIDFSFNFELSEELKAKVEAQIIEVAVKDAEAKAQVMANAAKLKLISIKNITYGKSDANFEPRYTDRYKVFEASDASNAKMESFNFTPQDIEMRDTVSIEWLVE